MSRSSDARRPYVRSTRSIVRRAAEGLASAAGRATPIERAHIEPLEPRKLLFSLTVTDDPDGDGLGEVVAQFGYFIPYLTTNIERGDEAPEAVLEDFSDEDIGAVLNNDVFDGSDIRFQSNAASAQIDALFNADLDPIEETQVLNVTSLFGNASFISFGQAVDPDDLNAGFNVTDSVQFTVGTGAFGTGTGFFNGQIEAQLLFDGRVVETFTNAELDALAIANPQPPVDPLARTINLTVQDADPRTGLVFDEVRFVTNVPDGDTAVNADFFIDDLQFTPLVGNNVELIDSRAFGAEVVFTAPVGATVSFFDLYDRPLINTIRVGQADQNVAEGDFDDDGVPDYNDGIGRIEITGTDERSSLSLIGLVVETSDPASRPDDAINRDGVPSDDPDDGEFFVRYEGLNLFDQFRETGFGFTLGGDADNLVALGLPPGTGSVIIGSPFVRPNSSAFAYDPYNEMDPDASMLRDSLDFQLANQGVFVNAESGTTPVSIGDVTLNAALFGLSRFSGSVNHFSTGYFMGSMSVNGDLGSFYNATDAGAWLPIGEDLSDDQEEVVLNTVGSQLLVGRTLGEFAVAGRNFTDIFVDGDLSDPTRAPAEDVLVYNEREVVFGIDPGQPDAELITLQQQSRAGLILPPVTISSQLATVGAAVVRPSIYGEANFRNDSILNAEFIGGASSTAVVRGTLSAADAFNTNIVGDQGDVYAFVTDGTSEIVIEQLERVTSVVRILDADGRTVAASELSVEAGGGNIIRFTPNAPGVYYISVLERNDGSPSPTNVTPYAFLISGMAPTTFGSYRTGLGNGGDREDPVNAGVEDNVTISVLAGNMGVVRTATSVVDGGGNVVFPAGVINTLSGLDSLLATQGLSISTFGNLYSFNAGGDINASQTDSAIVTLSIGGDLGQFYTGRSQLVGGGDAGNVIIETGGRIGTIDINGNINADGDSSPSPEDLVRVVGEPFVIRTGLDEDLRGDIGMIIVGGNVVGDELVIDTSASPGAVVGGLLVSQRRGTIGDSGSGGGDLGFFDGEDGVILNLGDGSDIRFVDAPRIDLREAQNSSLPILTGSVLELVDDAGGRVQISVTTQTATPVQVGRVVVVPVDGAEGVAIARIEVNLEGTGTLAGGNTLNITGLPGQSEADVISIGRIVVTGSDVGSAINISGSAQIDVWRIDAAEGLGRIDNQTPGGDIVAIDTATLDTIRILDGDLGRTEVVEFGPRLIGPQLGLQLGVNTTVFGSLGVDAAGDIFGILDPSLNGTVFRAINNGLVVEGAASLDDVGFPFDGALNGLVVRSGGLTLADAGGAIGDVIVQGGDIVTVRANLDRVTDAGDFDGIIGTVFSASNIEFVDVGDGLVGSETGTTTPFAEGGIFAQNNIGRVDAILDGAFINGTITAAAAFADDGDLATSGINQINVNSNGGDIFDSDIYVGQLDTFWFGELLDNDQLNFREQLLDLSVTNGDIFRSRIGVADLGSLRVTGGAYDATLLEVTGRVFGEIRADEFRNTTLDGGALEFAQSSILIGQDLTRLSTNTDGAFSDTLLSVVGEVNQGGIITGDIVRSTIEVANTLRSLTINGSMLASDLVLGRLISMSVQESIRASSISVSGPIESLRVRDEIDRTEISVTGPDGRIDTLEALNDLDADISSSGRVGTIRSTNGSIDGSIVTIGDASDVVLIDAAVDILSSIDIAGNLSQVQAGRNIGDANDRSVVLVRGNLTDLDVSGGRLLSDLRVGGDVTRDITIGGTVNLPGQEKAADGNIVVFGRIDEVAITGDFDGVITSESSGIGLITITDGSLLAGGGIIANDGGIGTVSIIRGHLFGRIYAELTINQIIVDGQGTAFGDIGINPNLSSGVSTNTNNDPNRNQLPPNVVATLDIDGPTIASGRAINSITVTSGDIYEAFIYARTFIGSINVQAGNITLNDPPSIDANLSDANVIAAGDLIQEVNVSGNVRSTLFLAGVTSFGDESIFLIGDPQYDDRPGNPTPVTALEGNDTNGAAGDDVDTLKSGTISTVRIGGDARNVAFNAGITAGDDGDYTQFDGTERNVLGLSIIDQITIGGTQTDVTFTADRGAIFVNGVNVRGSNAGATTPNEGSQLASLTDAFVGGPVDLSLLGTEVPRNGSNVFTWNGATFRVEWTAPPADSSLGEDVGQGVIWDDTTGTLILANTRIDHSVIVTVLDNDSNAATALPPLVDFDVRSNDEASIGTLRIQGENGRARLTGSSTIVVDNFVRTLEIDDYEGTGGIFVGEDIDTFTADLVRGGTFSAGFVRTTNVNLSLQEFGSVTPRFDYSGAASFNVAQDASATISIDRSIGSIDIGGTADRFLFRAGGSLTSFAANEVQRSRLSVSNVIDSIDVEGDVFDTSFIAGGDLGSDVADDNGATVASDAIDRPSSGSINTVTIGGDFGESDIIAGFLRGGDGFFGTADDDGAAGFSSIGTVTIGGSTVGSNLNSESYAILSAGGITRATIGGDDATSIGNFTVGQIVGEPVPIQVTNFEVLQNARVYTAFFTFNQNIDETSFLQALQIREVRDEASALQPFDPSDPLSLEAPTAGDPGSGDYSIAYDEEEFIFSVTFDREITDRDLDGLIDPDVDTEIVVGARQNLPSAGIYRFELLSNVLRAQNAQARLDGNGDGFAPSGEDFSFDDIVGDAGDVAGPRGLERVLQTGLNGNRVVVDFYDAVDLNFLLDSNVAPDGLPEVNNEFTVRGAIGDHPDRDLDLFGFGGDKDVYAVTLQAGQILRLGEATGAANQITRSLYFQPVGNGFPEVQYSSTGPIDVPLETPQTIALPSNLASTFEGDLSTDAAILIKETGTYYIVVEAGQAGEVFGNEFIQSAFTPGVVPNLDPQANQTGNYAFTLSIFDDGDTGFNSGSDSGNGTNVVDAPVLSAFSTTDRSERIVINDFTFQRLAGADGVFGNGDDVVTGSSSDGAIISTRTGNRLESTISSSLGFAGATGRPGEIFSDFDVFHLNNFQPITAGSLVTVTVKLAELGTDLGSNFDREFDLGARAQITEIGRDPSQAVQFALFETTNSTTQQNADLVFSPTDFTPRAGTPDTLIAENGPNRYGFDGNGDFFITFVVPPSSTGPGDGSYAVYLQGLFQGDYEIEVVTQQDAGFVVPSSSQNVLLETRGGTVDWLTVDGSPVSFDGFDAEALGFSGLVDNVSIDEFILAELVTTLNDLFDNAGLGITFSINPADFEFQEFSTVFLTSDNNPIDIIIGSDYGVSERSDPFNSDAEDEAVIFTPSYATLGYSPTPGDLDAFVDSLANGVARRVGELVGLRLTEANTFLDVGGTVDVFNEESIAFPFIDPFDPMTETTFEVPNTSRELANQLGGVFGIDDTGFFVGDQNAAGLLSLYLD